MWAWIRASNSKVSIFFIIVAFLVRWGLSLASIGTLEGKVTTLDTMEANFGSLFAGGWNCIRDQCRREMYTWIGASVEIVIPLPAIIVLLIRWGLCGILNSLWSLHLLISHDRGLEDFRVLDTLGSNNTYLNWLILWASLWTLIYIMSLFTTPEANLFQKGYWCIAGLSHRWEKNRWIEWDHTLVTLSTLF
jgi:hypothetical protein